MEKPISRLQGKDSWRKSHVTTRNLEMCFGKPQKGWGEKYPVKRDRDISYCWPYLKGGFLHRENQKGLWNLAYTWILWAQSEWIQEECGIWLAKGLRMWLESSRKKERCLEGWSRIAPKSSWTFTQKVKLTPVFLEEGTMVNSKKSVDSNSVQIWENGEVLLYP